MDIRRLIRLSERVVFLWGRVGWQTEIDPKVFSELGATVKELEDVMYERSDR